MPEQKEDGLVASSPEPSEPVEVGSLEWINRQAKLMRSLNSKFQARIGLEKRKERDGALRQPSD